MAHERRGEFEIDGRPVSWRRSGVVRGRPLLILGHGAGAPYTSPFMEGTVQGLVERGVAVACFHFPYMERQVREQKRRPPDPAPRLLATWGRMVEVAAGWSGHGALFAGGKSMGGRMASLWLAQNPSSIRGAVYLGYPLHPPGRPDRLRADHLPAVPVPQLFVSGSKDPLCDLDLLRPVLKTLPTARLRVVEGGDHSLALHRRKPMEGSGAWLDAVVNFLEERV